MKQFSRLLQRLAARAHWTTFALRAPAFALGAARRAHWTTFALRAPVFALGAARRAHDYRCRRREAWLAGATDVFDVERRLRACERGERHASFR
jgi:hypothetical protein